MESKTTKCSSEGYGGNSAKFCTSENFPLHGIYYMCIAINLSLSVAPKAPRKTRGELAKFVDADYYGYRDEDDGVIVPLEQEEERKG